MQSSDRNRKVSKSQTSPTQRVAKPSNGIVDNRPQAVLQRKLQQLANSSPRVIQAKGLGKGLPAQLKDNLEALSGYSLDDVQVHYNSSKPAEVGAHAYAQGSDIYLAPGQEKHLAHEAWHVVQQKQGRVRSTMQLEDGSAINDNVGLEHEADRMGQRSSHVGSPNTQLTKKVNSSLQSEVIQRLQIRNKTTETYDDVSLEVIEDRKLLMDILVLVRRKGFDSLSPTIVYHNSTNTNYKVVKDEVKAIEDRLHELDQSAAEECRNNAAELRHRRNHNSSMYSVYVRTDDRDVIGVLPDQMATAQVHMGAGVVKNETDSGWLSAFDFKENNYNTTKNSINGIQKKYIHYIFVPNITRVTDLDDSSAQKKQLPGLYSTDGVQNTIGFINENTGEFIPDKTKWRVQNEYLFTGDMPLGTFTLSKKYDNGLEKDINSLYEGALDIPLQRIKLRIKQQEILSEAIRRISENRGDFATSYMDEDEYDTEIYDSAYGAPVSLSEPDESMTAEEYKELLDEEVQIIMKQDYEEYMQQN